MRYLVAVSGGVDSVVLLDMLAKQAGHELIVAHFDHGIRPDSAEDARFVGALAEAYGLAFETERKELGSRASEDTARIARYDFLRKKAETYKSKIVTAHHQDDVIGTIAINLVRGTGWRGLSVLNDPSIERPLLRLTKGQLYEYATEHSLEWVEDLTNASPDYLRNRLRSGLARLDRRTNDALVDLFDRQRELGAEIDTEARRYSTNSRYFMTMIDEATALELLRAELAAQSVSLTRPRRRRLLHAIKTAKPGSTFEAGDGITVEFTHREFIVKRP